MESITNWLQSAILSPIPQLDDSSMPGKPRGEPRLMPEQLLETINAQEIAEWCRKQFREALDKKLTNSGWR